MRKPFLLFVLLASVIIFTQCDESEPTPEKKTGITYPMTGIFGDNILSMADSTVVASQITYSLAANLGDDAILKITMTNLSSSSKARWFFNAEANHNWLVTEYSTDNQQSFTSNIGKLLDLEMTFADTLGACRIDYYENNAQSPTRSKHLIWHWSIK